MTTLFTERLTLRTLDPSDAGDVAAYYKRTQTAFAGIFPALPPSFYTLAFWRARLAADIDDRTQGRAARWFLVCDNEVVGSVSLFHIRRGALQCANLGYNLDPALHRQGYMTEALTAVIRHAFGGIGLHRLQADHLPDNHASAALLARLGFEIEGYSKDYLLMADGRWHDHVRTARVNRTT